MCLKTSLRVGVYQTEIISSIKTNHLTSSVFLRSQVVCILNTTVVLAIEMLLDYD